jgi:hypothetical protein
MHTDARLVPGRVRLLSVQAPEDIEYLVKESEVLTGRSGRTFVIAGADRLVYRVHWQLLTESGGHARGPVVERLGRTARPEHPAPAALGVPGAQPRRGAGRRPVVHPSGPHDALMGTDPR